LINSVIHGDCLVEMQGIEDKSIDMILCDLPYGTTACKWDTIIPFEPLWAQYKRIIKDNGAIVLTASQPFTSALVMSNPKWFKYCWVWDKCVGMGYLDSKFRPLKTHEDVLVFSNAGCSNGSKPAMKYVPQDLIPTTKQNSHTTSKLLHSQPKENKELKTTHTNYPKTILKYPREAGFHPTQKPVALFEYLIKTYTNEGDTVLDNCAGSGTTAIACLNTGRNYILIEKEKQYIDVINDRIAKATCGLLRTA
jgi:site-specific DNA-methyltransferase (adenine-specific)